MPTQPLTTIDKGAIVTLLRQSEAVTALVPLSSIHADVTPPNAYIPLVVVEVSDHDTIWQNVRASHEKIGLTVTIRAVTTTTPGGLNPAEQIADAIESVLNWVDLTDGMSSETHPLCFLREKRLKGMESRLSANGQRVYRVVLSWRVEYSLISSTVPASGG